LPLIVIVVELEFTFAMVPVLPDQLTKAQHDEFAVATIDTTSLQLREKVPVPGMVTVPPELLEVVRL
jgi:hypothetical protein